MNGMQAILIIEEAESDRNVLSSILEDSYILFSVESAALAQKVLTENAVQLILSDVSEAEKENFALLKYAGQNGPIPVVLTGEVGRDVSGCLKEGASSFIAKPFQNDIVKNQVEYQLRLHYLSSMLDRVEHDGLTGVYNKEFFWEYVVDRLREDKDTAYDMVCLELESFHLLHGRYGVEKSNAFMKTMVDSLAQCLPPDVIIGRIDDAQVAILMRHIPFEIHRAFMAKCLQLAGDSEFLDIIINTGVYCNVDHTLPAEVICNHALLPLEKLRHNQEVFIAEYDDEIRGRELQKKKLTEAMYDALSEREFSIYYQPKYHLNTGVITGAEALVRWIHPQMGFMDPGEFIPLFEKNGFIYELDKYVLGTVCEDIRRWLEEGIKVVPVSVNVSQIDFDQADLAAVFEGIVDSHGIPHDLIHFEITESAEAPDIQKERVAVDSFRKRGFAIELDDFGAGYSTLTILGQLRVDVMKVDMNLIRNMFDRKYNAILRGTLYTAAGLNIKAIAEGVETEEQVDALKRMCSNRMEIDVQGYYYSRPLPVREYEEKLRELGSDEQ